MKTIQVPVKKPRNPLVAPSRFRRAGAHTSKRERLEKANRKEAYHL